MIITVHHNNRCLSLVFAEVTALVVAEFRTNSTHRLGHGGFGGLAVSTPRGIEHYKSILGLIGVVFIACLIREMFNVLSLLGVGVVGLVLHKIGVGEELVRWSVRHYSINQEYFYAEATQEIKTIGEMHQYYAINFTTSPKYVRSSKVSVLQP